MSKRTYNQYCALSAALDVLGERWTLLIVRDLLYGPKRFKDLHANLLGIGTGLLTARLNQLQADGVIERTRLPPPASTSAYQLTADGQALHGILVELARWGLPRVGLANGRTLATGDVLILALEASFDPMAVEHADGIYELQIDGTPYRLEINRRALDIRLGHATSPLTTAATDAQTLIDLTDGETTLEAALASGRVKIAGDLEAAARFAQAFGLAAPPPPAD
jgi:DNA-binding HxlR family transcriptional regulator